MTEIRREGVALRARAKAPPKARDVDEGVKEMEMPAGAGVGVRRLLWASDFHASLLLLLRLPQLRFLFQMAQRRTGSHLQVLMLQYFALSRCVNIHNHVCSSVPTYGLVN